ncbi:MAG: glycosyltransferase [Candidatus Anammoxibacter sp.]
MIKKPKSLCELMIITKPKISVIVEGYNEEHGHGSVISIVEVLQYQDFPSNQMEVIIVNPMPDTEILKKQLKEHHPFYNLKEISTEGASYYVLKNIGAIHATADILAYIDSDTQPVKEWVSSIVSGIENGADVVVGLSLFESPHWKANHLLMLTVASVSHSFVIGDPLADGGASAKSFLSHNVGFRRTLFLEHQYREDLGRTCGGWFLFKSLREAGAVFRLQAVQRVTHEFTFRWWLSMLHYRIGYEVHTMRRLDEQYPHRWIIRLNTLEPVLTMFWKILRDVSGWFRFSRFLSVPMISRILIVPVLMFMSFLGRGAEMLGMYKTILKPAQMKQFAETS